MKLKPILEETWVTVRFRYRQYKYKNRSYRIGTCLGSNYWDRTSYYFKGYRVKVLGITHTASFRTQKEAKDWALRSIDSYREKKYCPYCKQDLK